MQTKILSIRISKAESRALRAQARREGISQSMLVRRALCAYGVIPEFDSKRTAYDMIKHLLGKNRGGPRELSTDPKHLARYGR